MPNFIENTADSVLLRVLPGKRYLGSDEYQNQKAQKGPTCEYYATTLIRPRIGKKFESKYSKLKRTLVHLKENKILTEDKISEHEKTLEEVKSLRLAEKAISSYRKKLTPTKTLVQREKVEQEALCFLLDEQIAIRMRALGTIYMSSKVYTHFLLNACIAKKMYLKESAWQAKTGIDKLITCLKTEGPIKVGVFVDRHCYSEEIESKEEKSGYRVITLLSSSFDPKAQSSISHAIVIIGAKKELDGDHNIYFIDPSDDSPKDSLRKIYKWSYKQFVARVNDSIYCADEKKLNSLEERYRTLKQEVLDSKTEAAEEKVSSEVMEPSKKFTRQIIKNHWNQYTNFWNQCALSRQRYYVQAIPEDMLQAIAASLALPVAWVVLMYVNVYLFDSAAQAAALLAFFCQPAVIAMLVPVIFLACLSVLVYHASEMLQDPSTSVLFHSIFSSTPNKSIVSNKVERYRARI